VFDTTESRRRPLVLAHRGASGYRPEHTLAAYELAIEHGADYLEPDLVMTQDGVLVDRHEPEISGTTDIQARRDFADRKTTKSIDGRQVTGWFVEDFTLEELKSLRATERIPALRVGNTAYDRLWEIPTFSELLKFREELSEQCGRPIGIIPEIKHSTYLHSLGFKPEQVLVELIDQAGLNNPRAPLWIQSFEVSNLIALREQYGYRANLLFLNSNSGAPFDLTSVGDQRSYSELLKPAGLSHLSRWVDAIGPDKRLVIPRLKNGRLGKPTSLVADAHAEGLQVIPWTFRAENHFLPKDYQIAEPDGTVDPSRHGRAVDEILTYLEAGIDAIFGDHTEVAVAAAEIWRRRRA
jgi:glycerophosphoryl diester phosphodiesterase